MLTKTDKVKWLRVRKLFNNRKGKGTNYLLIVPRRKDTKFTNPMGKTKSIITLPGVTGVNEGPVVDIFTETYIAAVKLIEGAYVRINRSPPTVS